MERREFLRYLGVSAGLALTAACAPATAPAPTTAPAAAPAGGTPGAAKSNGSKLTVWGWQSFTPDGDKLLGDQITQWGAANNTQVEYVVVENAQFPQKLAAAIEAKAPPDVVMLTAASNVVDYASRQLFADVSDVWKATSTQAGGFWSYVDPLYKIGSTYYGIPFEADTSPMFARTDLIKQASGSTDPPKTLDDLTTMCQKINDPPNVYAFGFTLGRTPDCFGNTVAIIWNDGGTLVDKSGKVALNSPETVMAINRIKGWWDAKIIPPDSPTWDDTGNNAAFQKKQAAFVLNPPSIYGWMVDNDKDLLNNATMAAIPAGKSGSYSGSGSWSWSVFQSSKNVDGSKDLIHYLLDPARLQALYSKVGGRWYPIYQDGTKDEFWTSKPQFQFYPDLLKGGRDISYPAPPDPNLFAALGEIQTRLIIPDMVQNVIVKGMGVQDAVQQAHDAMVEVFKAHGANA
ncbi:MAG: extracellular solute-binding protein [Chloroflexi bacterium]|nr:extracellular solute-binding protein [Chloroflexota bacterium]MBV9133593.1 extracellular solute-binding protein [Chloroflexota bacterium]MBV9893886.1 extracellular solute-binding protein [Chloroflexota bacterium]